ncbi:hypothetical protein KXD40_008980 [Peronospora effusa]|uniref:Uncharacterized protein n=1 Tax=Peronospora effusa TaxID=542832 RepID=A0A3M6VPC7_9STRA|nr:hypothetical protein DD238_008169 [Peronospora effusa]RQM18783.1 hypothetical protein DD237_008253 [Peronospora effusa]UIZ25195.1 hypothetical protein KXD40_008980 [Peronospora effusa]
MGYCVAMLTISYWASAYLTLGQALRPRPATAGTAGAAHSVDWFVAQARRGDQMDFPGPATKLG